MAETIRYREGIDLNKYPVERLVTANNWARLTGEAPEDTRFHVVIPAHNEEDTIDAVLTVFANQYDLLHKGEQVFIQRQSICA